MPHTTYNLNIYLNANCFILDIPGFAQDVIRSMVDRVWKNMQGEQVVPVMLPPHPSQYNFPEAHEIQLNVDSSLDWSGNDWYQLN